MNKSQLIEDVQRRLGEDCSRSFAEKAVAAVLESVGRGLTEDGAVQILGFGTFEVRERAERQGRNPRTKEPILIPAARSVKFKPGAHLKGLVTSE